MKPLAKALIAFALAVIEGEPWNWSDGSPEDRERWRAEVGEAARRLHARVLAQVEDDR